MRKKRILSGVIAGILIVAMAGGITAFASTGQKTLTANFNNIKIIIDGETLTPKDGAGNQVEPFTVDGVTFVPLRAIAEAFGTDVRWDGSTSSVIITKPDGIAPPSSQPTAPSGNQAKLSDMSSFTYQSTIWAKDWEASAEMRMNTGDFASDVLYASYMDPAFGSKGGEATVDYLVDSRYSRLSGTLFLEYDSRSPRSTQRLIIWGDGKQLYRSPDISGGFMPTEIDVDITNVKVLRIGAEFDGGSADRRTIGISNTILTK